MRSKRELNLALVNLAALGYSVKIRHLRCVNENKALVTRGEAKRLGYTLNPKGGLTEVRLVDQNGVLQGVAEARTSFKDNFNSERGLLIAVGRLIKARKQELRTRMSESKHRRTAEEVAARFAELG